MQAAVAAASAKASVSQSSKVGMHLDDVRKPYPGNSRSMDVSNSHRTAGNETSDSESEGLATKRVRAIP